MRPLYFQKKDWKILNKIELKNWFYKITEVKQIRSIAQNRFYFWYILKLIVKSYLDFWYIHTTEELHTIFKKAFIPKVKIKSDFSKKFIYQIGSTTQLNTKQFKEFIDQIKIIFEFWEMEKLGLEKIDNLIISDIREDDLIYWESLII